MVSSQNSHPQVYGSPALQTNILRHPGILWHLDGLPDPTVEGGLSDLEASPIKAAGWLQIDVLLPGEKYVWASQMALNIIRVGLLNLLAGTFGKTEEEGGLNLQESHRTDNRKDEVPRHSEDWASHERDLYFRNTFGFLRLQANSSRSSPQSLCVQ